MGWYYIVAVQNDIMVLSRELEETAAKCTDLPNAESVYNTDEEISLRDIFDEEFVQEWTEFESLDELVATSPSKAISVDDLGGVSSGEWDEFIAESTDFADEEEFVMTARDHWVAKQLNLS
ncbi:hypothetical protein ACLI4Q_20455 [Natrialbaceae archaeon A-CW1-1]